MNNFKMLLYSFHICDRFIAEINRQSFHLFSTCADANFVTKLLDLMQNCIGIGLQSIAHLLATIARSRLQSNQPYSNIYSDCM